jgi:type II secretory pathway pseudopilin PulG
MAYFISPSINNRRRGFVMVTTGVVLAIIGAAFSLFINLIQYVLSG